MHLADALRVPVIALFGQGKLPLWSPSGPHSHVISHQNDPDFFLCHPIEENAEIGKKFMNRIEVAEVVERLTKVPLLR
jgi:ADP-heptose:LPS heptosyltransferase